MIEELYFQCMARGFNPLGPEASGAGAGFTLAKEEGTTLCLLQVVDHRRLEYGVYPYLKGQELARADGLKSMYGSVWVVFLQIGGTPDFDKAEAYFGQSPYVVYWHVDPQTGDFSVPQDQPDDVMGLKSAIIDSVVSPPQKTGCSDEPAEEIEPEPQFPLFTTILAIANIIVMAMMYLQGYAAAPLIVAARFGAIIPHLIWGAGEYYRLFTAMFVHFGWMHLFFNVAGMMIFGARVEKYYGKAFFLAIYFISGLTASAASLLLTRGFSAGASGAVYGLIGAAFIYTKLTKRSMDVISNQIVLVYIIMGLGMGFVMPGIDYFGHIGGLAAGILVGLMAVKLL